MQGQFSELRVPVLVRMIINSELLTGAPSLERVAENLGVSPRTLQRQLAESETSFSAIVRDARMDLSQSLLEQSQLPINEIAHRAGFASSANFCRAFQSWLNMSPGDYRRRVTDGAN